MKNLSLLFLFIAITSCATNSNVYWCGDHPCINKKEKEAYFKKTMIVEIKELKKSDLKKDSKIEKITQQVLVDEKKRIKKEKNLAKQAKLEEKIRIKKEKDLAKQAKLEEKMRIKNEKELAKKAKLEEKKRIKDEKRLIKEIKKEEKQIIKKDKVSSQKAMINTTPEKSSIELSDFKKIVEKITKRNSLKPYPEINDIPN